MKSIVKTDVNKNRLYIVFGTLKADEYEAFSDAIIQKAGELERGFTCITDLRGFTTNNPGDTSTIDKSQLKRVQLALMSMGMSHHVRVALPQARLYSALAASEKEAVYSTYFYDNFEEAEKALDQL